jgi:putative transport protein
VKQIADELGEESQGVHLQRMMRQENLLPKLPNTIIERGDVIDLVGRRDDIERVAARIGYIDGPSDKSDLIFIAIACVVGTLVGLLSVNIGNIALSLGASGGILVTGLLFGWLHSRMPKFGRVPPAAIWIMETLGLNVFVAAVGLAAAPHALAAMQENGLQLSQSFRIWSVVFLVVISCA